MTVSWYRKRGPWRPPAGAMPLLLALLLILLGVVACGGGNDDQAQDGSQPVTDRPALVCSQTCRDQGQCGSSTDRGTVVLLRRNEPAVDGHDLAVTENTTVELLDVQPRTVVQTVDGSEFQLNFFKVRIPDRNNVEGWVASWCTINMQS